MHSFFFLLVYNCDQTLDRYTVRQDILAAHFANYSISIFNSEFKRSLKFRIKKSHGPLKNASSKYFDCNTTFSSAASDIFL